MDTSYQDGKKKEKKITKWNPKGMRSKRRPKNEYGNEMLNYLRKCKVNN